MFLKRRILRWSAICDHICQPNYITSDKSIIFASDFVTLHLFIVIKLVTSL